MPPVSPSGTLPATPSGTLPATPSGTLPVSLNGLRVPARLVRQAVIARAAESSLRVDAFEPFEDGLEMLPPGTEVTALICDGGVHHYFHCMEALIWLAALLELLGAPRLGRIIFAWPWDNAAQNHVQRSVLAALHPDVPIGDPGGVWPATYAHVLVFDRSWQQTSINKVLEAAMGIARPAVLAMGARARAAVGAGALREAECGLRILYVTRPPPRCLVSQAERHLLAVLGRHGQVTTCDFAAIPWEQQVRLVASHDVLVGVHGNGLTNALWLRPGSLVLELFPDGVRHYDYQLFAELADLAYFGFERDRVFPAFCRTGAAYGHQEPTNQPVTSVPEAAVERLLGLFVSLRGG